MSEERLILVTNDDGYNAPGIEALIEVAAKFGRVVVVAPKEPQSGKGHAITSYLPLYPELQYKSEGVEVYSLNGTPVDCVKFATDHLLLSQKIDLVVSGINHGSNASINILYSGTMGAAIEGSFYAAPSIGFSHLSNSEKSDLEASKYYAERVIRAILSQPIELPLCLNINIPDLALEHIKGIRVARQNRGYWLEEFFGRSDPRGKEYFWLSGEYVNHEPSATDTDIAALDEGYVSVVPVQVDLTAYSKMEYTESLLLAATPASPRETESDDRISLREMEILKGICQGLSNQEIADMLFISKRTVDKHRANILKKTGCRNTANLVVYAIKHSLIEL